MEMKNLFKKDHVIGIDIGSTSVKIAQFKESPDGLCLVKADINELGT